MIVKLECTDCLQDVSIITGILAQNDVNIKSTRSKGISIQKIITIQIDDDREAFLNKLIAHINTHSHYGVTVLKKKKKPWFRR